jgi:serine/threonine protein phosphatase PrpC
VSFDIDVGHASERGPSSSNEDFAAVCQPDAADEPLGWIAALADGVSTGGAGLLAAQTTVMTLVHDYFGAPATWDTTVALDRLIEAQNAWLADHNRRRAWERDAGTALTTLTAVVLRGHSFTLAHVGDTRAWLLRDGECTQLTQDHVLPDMRLAGQLTRAIGLEEHVRVDYLQRELQAGDCLVLTSDGVHRPLSRQRLAAIVQQASDAQAASTALVREALAAGGDDNATALVLRVRGLAAGRYEDVLGQARTLPVPPRLNVGAPLDGFTITALVADTGVHRLYQARDASGALVAIKTLHESRASDDEERAMLAHEAWLGARLTERLAPGDAAGFVRVHELHEPSAFYVVYDWHAGRTLQQRLQDKPRAPISEVVAAAIACARALGRLHRAGVVHRDIKPANLHGGDDGQWRILDLGVALSGREPKVQRTLHAGTPSYMNPEQWDDEPAAPDAASDLYALGVTLYQWLTGKLPYGEIEPYQRARFRRDPARPSRHAPDVPIWLDHLVCKAVARDAKQRFETAEELVIALERGASRPLAAPPATPLALRDPHTLMKIALGVSLLLNALLIYWLLFLPR